MYAQLSSGARVITVKSEIFARFFFSRIVLKNIFAALKIRDFGMFSLHQ